MNRSGKAVRCVVIGLACFAITAAPQARADGMLVFAAASLKNALDAVVAAYTDHHDADIRVVYAGSSTLARQIERGAPAQVFISANRQWMAALEDRHLIAPDTRVALLRNALVLIAPADRDTRIKLAPGVDLTHALANRPLAMANTTAVPAGIYGRQALQTLAIWQTLQPRVAQTEDVRAALALVARGEARLGIVYASDALAEDDVRVVDTFRAATHDPIVYPAALLAGVDGPRAEKFLSFLQSDTAGRIFRRWGFKRAAAN